jgi:hypothetical protein
MIASYEVALRTTLARPLLTELISECLAAISWGLMIAGAPLPGSAFSRIARSYRERPGLQ